LVRPTSGTATITGRAYRELDRPLRTVGAALEAADFHPGRTALDHLRVYAPQAGVPDSRAEEVLDLVGLTGAARRRVGGFSLGMRQRLGLATTLLGDPPVLLLDEPANGLDPEGIRWLRDLLRALAAQGRTVLVSSHVLSEVQRGVDDVVIIAGGRLVHASTLADLSLLAEPQVRVVSPDPAGLDALVARSGWRRPAPEVAHGVPGAPGAPGAGAGDGAHVVPRPGVVDLVGTDVAAVGHAAFAAGLELHELSTRGVTLEELFLRLTAPPAPGAPGGPVGPAPTGPAPTGPAPTGPAPSGAPTDPAGGAR
ncbi:MAG TPA: ATP-binding cassette domain-containing protein, partial [Cellulomonas sp.]